MAERHFFVVVYDVVDDKRRLKVARYLESIGERVQYSVFETYLTEDELTRLVKKIEKIIKLKDDSVRIYRLCSNCRGYVRALGVGVITKPPEVVIV
jgi:CRISPR-associated protein Cas2